MTYPVDDKGNPRVDFVWGPFPLQPNQQRTSYGQNIVTNQDQNIGWTTTFPIDSANLSTGWTELSFGTGDGGNSRTQTFTWDNHEIAASNYEGYPSFIQGAPYNDTVPNRVVPNLIGLTIEQADAALSSLELSSDAHTTTVGATSGNNGKIASQVPAAGTVVNMQDVVLFTTYDYVAPATTGPIAGFNRSSTHWSLNGNEVVMYVLGRTVKPTIGATITVSGTSESDWNQNWTVEDIVNDDSYNTGGTAVKLAYVDHTFTNSTSSSGTWTAI